FRTVEFRGGRDLRYDRPLVLTTALERLFGGPGRRFLLGGVEEDDGSILRSHVRALPVQLRGIVVFPEDAQQILIRNLGRIVLDFHHFRVPGPSRADILIRWVLEGAAGITDRRRNDALYLPERGFHAPEAAGAKCCLLCHHRSSSRTSQPNCCRVPGNQSGMPWPARICSILLTSEAATARAFSSTTSASARGTTTTPFASPITISPGRTGTPPTATGTFTSPGPFFRAPLGVTAGRENTGSPTSQIPRRSRTDPSVTIPASRSSRAILLVRSPQCATAVIPPA